MFGNFYNFSSYSILKSTLKLEELFIKTKENKHDFISICEDGNLYSMYSFLHLAKKYELKAILGLKVVVGFNEKQFDLNLFAYNDQGVSNLILLNNKINLLDEVLNIADLELIMNGLIVCLPVYNQNIDSDFSLLAKNLKAKYKFYLGLTTQTNQKEEVNKIIIELNCKTLLSNKIAYLTDDSINVKALEILKSIGTSKITEKYDLSILENDNYQSILSMYPNANIIINTTELVNAVKYNNIFPEFKMPKYINKHSVKSNVYLKELTQLGLTKRLNGDTKQLDLYKNRLDYELKVINDMGYDDYFLIVYDVVKFCKDNDILVGPGRGSAAGSLVSYCLGITRIDPIKYNLLFERFLNPQRVTMPDIDLDFPDDKRDLVLEYVYKKYGQEHVIGINTFSTFAYKSALRDICKELKIDSQRTTGIVSSIENNKIDESDLQLKEVYQISQVFDGIPRQTGTHPAGIILADEKLTSILPLKKGPHLMYQSQFEQYTLERMGLLKIDFLGLRNLSLINDMLIKTSLDLHNIPLNDKKTYELLQSGLTQGIFQLESNGMQNVLKKLKPETFEDLVAVLALFRPGPMQNIDVYTSRKNGQKYEPLDSSIEEILKPTYGIIIYQEQIMQIASKFANYSLQEADILRMAISKKNEKILLEQQEMFIKKAIAFNKSEAVAKKIYQYILRFAEYGFNRSHSVSYALFAYQMAYLKANYFEEFMCVLLNNALGSSSETINLLNEVKQKGIKILPPHVNYSLNTYQLKDKMLLLPFRIIKGIDLSFANELIKIRNVEKFKDFEDFLVKTKDIFNRTKYIALTYANALACFKYNKQTLIACFNSLNTSYLGFTEFTPRILDEYDEIILTTGEKEVLGFNLVYDPYKKLTQLNEKYKIKPLNLQTGSLVKVIGKIAKSKTIIDKKGQEMAFIDVTDLNETLQITIFNTEYIQYKNLLNEDFLLFTLKKDNERYILKEINKI